MKLFLVFIVALLFYCCSNSDPKSSVVIDKFKPNVPQDSMLPYFPFDSLLASSDSDKRIEGYHVKMWARKALLNFQEPSLYNYSGEGEAIRLLWLPSFGNPVVIRVSNFNDTIYANIKEQKEWPYEDGHAKIITDKIIALSTEKWKEILSDLQTNNFWKAKVEDSSSGKDGIPWLLECRLNNKYYYIDRWDEGDLTSRDLNLYAKELVDIGKSFVQMKSRK